MLRKYLSKRSIKALALKVSLLTLIIPFLFNSQTVQAERPKPVVATQAMEITATPMDPRALVLHDYLAQYDSPLQDYAQDIVNAADEYNVDWKLVPAIAGVESTFGKEIPGDYEPGGSISYNGWGWGVYGDQAMYFSSWKDGIYTVTKGLREGYLDKGLATPYAMNPVYASSPTWGVRVAYFLADIDQYAQSRHIDIPMQPSPLKVGLNAYLQEKPANGSAQLSHIVALNNQ